MKRSSQPVFWLLFGAGGMLSALIGAMLVFITGIAAPLGWFIPPGALDYANAKAFAQSLIGKGFLFAVVTLFLWHGAHRIFHSVHDLGLPAGRAAQTICYGGALLGTLAVLYALLRIGF